MSIYNQEQFEEDVKFSPKLHQQISEEIYDYMVRVHTPVLHRSDILMVGECLMKSGEGLQMYTTFYRREGLWFYFGVRTLRDIYKDFTHYKHQQKRWVS